MSDPTPIGARRRPPLTAAQHRRAIVAELKRRADTPLGRQTLQAVDGGKRLEVRVRDHQSVWDSNWDARRGVLEISIGSQFNKIFAGSTGRIDFTNRVSDVITRTFSEPAVHRDSGAKNPRAESLDILRTTKAGRRALKSVRDGRIKITRVLHTPAPDGITYDPRTQRAHVERLFSSGGQLAADLVRAQAMLDTGARNDAAEDRGRDALIQAGLMQDKDELLREATALAESTPVGRRVLKHLRDDGVKVHLQSGSSLTRGLDRKELAGEYNPFTKTITIAHEAGAIPAEIAETLVHEAVHHEDSAKEHGIPGHIAAVVAHGAAGLVTGPFSGKSPLSGALDSGWDRSVRRTERNAYRAGAQFNRQVGATWAATATDKKSIDYELDHPAYQVSNPLRYGGEAAIGLAATGIATIGSRVVSRRRGNIPEPMRRPLLRGAGITAAIVGYDMAKNSLGKDSPFSTGLDVAAAGTAASYALGKLKPVTAPRVGRLLGRVLTGRFGMAATALATGGAIAGKLLLGKDSEPKGRDDTMIHFTASG